MDNQKNENNKDRVHINLPFLETGVWANNNNCVAPLNELEIKLLFKIHFIKR